MEASNKYDSIVRGKWFGEKKELFLKEIYR